MRLSIFLTALGVAGVSVLVTTYALRSGNSVQGFAVSAREKMMLKEIARLHQTIESMTADLNRIDLNPNQPDGAAPAVNKAAPKRDTTPLATAPDAPTTVASSGELPRPQVLMVNPTPEQNAIFEGLKQRFDDPAFVATLNLAELSQMEEVKALPSLLQKVILSKALAKLDRGEVDKTTFYTNKRAQPR